MEKIVFFGDSITDSNRNYESPIGTIEQLGDGYVRYVASELFIEKGYQLQVINQGVNGNRITDLQKRLENDVIDLEPEYCFIMIGVNDVWRHYDAKMQNINQIDADTFRKEYQSLLEKLISNKIKVLVSSCFYLEVNNNDKMKQQIDTYNTVIEELAKKYAIPYLNVQKEMEKIIEGENSYFISTDRVHLNHIGNTYLGKQVLSFVKKNIGGF